MIHEFINYLVNVKGYSRNTAEAYEKDLHDFCRFLQTKNSGTRWSTIQLCDIDEYKAHMMKREMSAATINRHLSSISAIFRYFQREGLLNENPCKYESRHRQAQQVPNVIPMDEILKAAAHASSEIGLAIMVLATTGIRLQELMNLRKIDLCVKNNSIRVKGKGNKERIVFTTTTIMAGLQAHSAGRAYYIWETRDQRAWRREIFNALRPYSNAKQLSPHAIRHTFATEMTAKGMPTATLAQLMGHQSVKTTEKYLNLNPAIMAGQYQSIMN